MTYDIHIGMNNMQYNEFTKSKKTILEWPQRRSALYII